MRENALHIIRSVRKKWIAVVLVSHILLSMAISLLISCLAHFFFGWQVWMTVVFFIAAFIILLFTDRSWQVTKKDTVKFLDKTYLSLEESSELLLRDPQELNLLEQLQQNKMAEALQQIQSPPLFKKIKRSLIFAGCALLICFLLYLVPAQTVSRSNNIAHENPPALPAGVSEVDVKIIPPAYTNRKPYEQQTLNLQAEEGAAVHWKIKTNGKPDKVQFIYNDSLTVALHATDETNGIWESDKIMDHPGFYQLKIDSTVSELYKIELIADQPPVITVITPKPTTVIEYGEPAKVNLQVSVSDDYGVKDISIHATIAKGSGEGVKFKEQTISFGVSFGSQQKKYDLQKIIGLGTLGMEPGDELYFYLNAIDNHGQEKRSDMFIVSIADTAQLMSMEALLNGVNLKPDYFRSQRQIIIETEQLVKDKDTAFAENFRNRSNNLGIDQKLLRLRYGKFLGEEALTNEDNPGNGLGNPEDFGNAAVILDAFTDKHDNAEDATFLDTETKKQLRATLTEMWGAELHLRLFQPKEALPFEYKALRLLKDLQQRSRAYVAKTSIKTPPIKLEKRLTGKLEKITEPVTHADIIPTINPTEILRNALRILEQLKNENIIDNNSIQILRLATAQLSSNATKEPSVYLKPLEAMKKIIAAAEQKRSSSITDIIVSEKALQQLTEVPSLLPSKKTGIQSLSLPGKYFSNLQKTEQH